MALLDRSLISSSFVIRDIGTFIIHPEYLEDEELEYELRIRSEIIAGSRRELSARLRTIIAQEQANEKEVPLTGYSVPSQEIKLCESKLPILQGLLGLVDRDISSQNRYMTKHLHVEGRANRISKATTALNVTDRVFALNERLSELYHEFCSKVRQLGENKTNQKGNSDEQDKKSIAEGGEQTSTNNLQEKDQRGKKDNGEIVDLLGTEVDLTNGNQVQGQKQQATGDRKKDTKPKEDRQTGRPFGGRPRQNNMFDDLYRLPTRDEMGGMKQNKDKKRWYPMDQYNPYFLAGRNRDAFLDENFHQGGGSLSDIRPNGPQGFSQSQIRGSFPPQMPMTSSRMDSGVYQNLHNNFGDDRRSSMPLLPDRRSSMPQSNNNAGRGLPQVQGQQQQLPPPPPPTPNPIESAMMEMAAAMHTIIEQLDSFENRIGSIEQRNRTYTVQPQMPTSSGETQFSANRNGSENGQAQTNANNNGASTQPQMQANERPYQCKRIPIHKWGLYFTGNSKSEIPEEKDARAFLKRLAIYRDAEDVTYGELFQKFHYLLKGSALNWYTQYRHEFLDWNQLKAGFLKQYTTPLSKFVTAAKLASRRQQKTESATDYIASIIRDFDEMEVHDEEERISIVQNGLLPELRNRAMSRDWQSVQEMNIWLRKTETADRLYETPVQPIVKKFFYKRPTMAMIEKTPIIEEYEEASIEEIGPEMVDEMEEIGRSQCNAISRFSGSRRNFGNKKPLAPTSGQGVNENKPKSSVCYNCKKDSHYFHDCDQPITRMFCFRCGKDDTLAPNCECKKSREQSKNLATVAAMTAESCDE